MNGPVTEFLSKDEEEILCNTILKGFPRDEQQSFIRICQRTRLDPFTRQIYATKRWTKTREGGKALALVPVTGIQGLTAVADRTGQYDGCELFWAGPDGIWQKEWLSDEPPAAAKCIVHHKGRTHPEVAIARWFSYVGQFWDNDRKQWTITEFWERMPDHMLAKCSKALALRGAFPDPLSNVYIREELESNVSDAETETLDPDEQKIAANQRHEEEVLAKAKAEGIKVVESKPGKRPTPAEALKPAFPEDEIPKKPKEPPPSEPPPSSAPVPKKTPPKAPVAAQPSEDQTGGTPDDLDMGDEEPKPPQGEQTPPPGEVAPEPATPWKDHVIKGIRHQKFFNRKVGDLSPQELGAMESQWLPAVRQQWEDATDDQRRDAEALEAAIAFQKMRKPW